MKWIYLALLPSLVLSALADEPTPTPSPLKSRVMKYYNSEHMEFGKKEVAAIKEGIATIHWSLSGDPATAAQEDYDAIQAYVATVTDAPDGLGGDLLFEGLCNYQPTNPNANGSYFAAMGNAQVRGAAKRREADEATRPEFDGMWGVSFWVHNAIKAKLRDPESYKFISVREPYTSTFNGSKCWVEKVHFRSKNDFGGYSLGVADVSVIKAPNSEEETVLDVQIHEEQ